MSNHKKRQSTVDWLALGGKIMTSNNKKTYSRVARLATALVVFFFFVCGANAQTKLEDGNRCTLLGAGAIYDTQNNGIGGELQLTFHRLHGGVLNMDYSIKAGVVTDDVLSKHRMHAAAQIKWNVNANPHHRLRVGIFVAGGVMEQATAVPAGATASSFTDEASVKQWLAMATWSGKARGYAEGGLELTFKPKASSRWEIFANASYQHRFAEGNFESSDFTSKFDGSGNAQELTKEQVANIINNNSESISSKFSKGNIRVSGGIRFRF